MAHLRFTTGAQQARVVNIPGLNQLVGRSIATTNGPTGYRFNHTLMVMMNGEEYDLDLTVTKACVATENPTMVTWLCQIADVELEDGRLAVRHAELTICNGRPRERDTGLVTIQFTS